MNFKKGLQNVQGFFQKHPILAIGLLYFVCALVFSLPLVFKISSEIPAGRGDVFQAMANIDSRVETLTSLDFGKKINFLVKNLNVYLPYVLLNLVVNKYVAYNVLFLASFVLSGLGAYLLALYFVKNRAAAFLAGLIFAFCPFHFYQATVVNLGTMQQQWLPFLALFLFRFFEKFEFKYFVAFVSFAFLIAMNEHQMLAFSALFILMVAIYKIAMDRSVLKNKKFWSYVGCSVILLAIVTFGMFGQMLKVATSDNNFLNAGMGAANKYSIKALDPLLPPIFHSLYPGFGEAAQDLILGDTNRGSYFVGFSVFGMLLYLGYLFKKKRISEMKEDKFRKDFLFWVWVAAVFYVFSLGVSFTIGKLNIYLPYFLVYKLLPFYENIRTTGRMFVFAILAVAMLFAYGYVQLAKRHPQKRTKLFVVFSILILLEFWVAPMRTMVIEHSPFYDQLAKDKEAYKLIEIPGSTSYEFASYAMMTNVIHGKQVLNGMPLARKLSGEFDLQQGTPVLKQLLYTIPKGNDPDAREKLDIIESFDYANSNDVLNYYNVRYITISKIYANREMQKLAQSFIEKHIATLKRYEDQYLIAYEVAPKVPKGIFVEIKGNNKQFSQFNANKDGAGWREMGDGATLRVVNISAGEQNVTVSVKARSSSNLRISSAFDATKNSVSLNDTEQQYSFVTALKPGENMISFSLMDASGKAVKNTNKKKNPQGAIVSQILIEEIK